MSKTLDLCLEPRIISLSPGFSLSYKLNRDPSGKLRFMNFQVFNILINFPLMFSSSMLNLPYQQLCWRKKLLHIMGYFNKNVILDSRRRMFCCGSWKEIFNCKFCENISKRKEILIIMLRIFMLCKYSHISFVRKPLKIRKY